MIRPVNLLLRDAREWIILEKYRGRSIIRTLFISLPRKSLSKLYALVAGFINNHFLINLFNSKRFQEFQNYHQDKLGDHFYIIVMPNILPYLVPCLSLIPKHINLFLILNGTDQWEENFLRSSYEDYPIFKLNLLPFSSLSYGRLLNLLLTYNHCNFGIIDHDLFIFNKNLFNELNLSPDEFIIGIFQITNKISQLTFPNTHFLFFNTIPIKQIMLKYNIGAQKYRIIPSHLKKMLASLKLGYHNFLKGYLNYFDTLNLIMAMAFYDRLSAKILEFTHFKDVYHLGGTSHGPDNLYRTYRNLKFLEMPQNHLLREKYSGQFSSFDSSKNMVKLFPNNKNTSSFIHETDQLIEKLEKNLPQ